MKVNTYSNPFAECRYTRDLRAPVRYRYRSQGERFLVATGKVDFLARE